MAKKKSSSRSGGASLLSLLGIAALGYLAFKWLAGHVSAKVEVTRIGIKIGAINFPWLPVTLSIHILNTSGLPLPIEGFEGTLLYGDTPIAPVQITHAVTLTSGQEVVLPVTIMVNVTETVANLVDIVASGSFVRELHVRGKARAAGVVFDLDYPVSLT